MENRIDEIRELIGDVEILAAINEVIELTKSLNQNDLRDDAFLLKSNQVQLNQDRQRGLSSSDESAARQNKIIDQVLDLLTELEGRVMQKPIPPKPEQISTSTFTPKPKPSNKKLPMIVISVIVGLLILFFGYRFIKKSSTGVKELPKIEKIDNCEEVLKKIETLIAEKDLQSAKNGLIKADKVCDDKIHLTLLVEEYNAAVIEAKQTNTDTPPSNTDNTPPNKPEDEGTKPGDKPGIVRPGNIKPEIIQDIPFVSIKPGVLQLDTWTGIWSTDFGDINITQLGSTDFVGDYIKTKGWLLGKYDKNTNTWKGTFFNGISKKKGFFEFKKSGKSFKGEWGWEKTSVSGVWKGKQTTQEKPTLRYYPASIYGRVYDINGKPIANATIKLNTYIAYTDDKGVYKIHIPNGKYTVAVNHVKYYPQKERKTYLVNDNNIQVSFKLKPR